MYSDQVQDPTMNFMSSGIHEKKLYFSYGNSTQPPTIIIVIIIIAELSLLLLSSRQYTTFVYVDNNSESVRKKKYTYTYFIQFNAVWNACIVCARFGQSISWNCSTKRKCTKQKRKKVMHSKSKNSKTNIHFWMSNNTNECKMPVISRERYSAEKKKCNEWTSLVFMHVFVFRARATTATSSSLQLWFCMWLSNFVLWSYLLVELLSTLHILANRSFFFLSANFVYSQAILNNVPWCLADCGFQLIKQCNMLFGTIYVQMTFSWFIDSILIGSLLVQFQSIFVIREYMNFQMLIDWSTTVYNYIMPKTFASGSMNFSWLHRFLIKTQCNWKTVILYAIFFSKKKNNVNICNFKIGMEYFVHDSFLVF